MGFMRSFSRSVKAVKCLNYTSGTADRTTGVIDTAGYGGLAFVVDLAAVAASAVTNIYVAHADAASDTNTLTSGANVATTSQTIDDTDDNQTFIVDLKPTKRYYQLTVNKDGSNACAESVVAYLYNPAEKPVTQGGGNTSVVGDGHAAVNYEFVGVATSGTI